MRQTTARILFLMIAALALLPNAQAKSRSVNYLLRRANGVNMHVVYVNVHDPLVRVTGAIAKNGIGSHEPFSSMIKRTHPTAALTGSFFGVDSKVPVGDLVIGSLSVNRGRKVGTAFAINSNGKPVFGPKYDPYWKGYETVFSTGIRLVKKGKTQVEPWAQGFKDRSLYALKPRTAIAVDKKGKLMLVAVNQRVYLSQLASALKRIGAIEAVALDGGSSTGLYMRGKYMAKPQRSLTNILLVYEHSATYQKHLASLAPGVAQKKTLASAKKPQAVAASPKLPESRTAVKAAGAAPLSTKGISSGIILFGLFTLLRMRYHLRLQRALKERRWASANFMRFKV